MEDLVILKQESLGREQFSRNDIQKEVHVVAKNLPFTIDVGSSTVNLSGTRVYAKLYYDSPFDMDFKPVDYVKQEPMTYKVFLDPTGQKATVEFRVGVLTSQHEDSLFRIKVGILVNDIPTEVSSEAIRVVSKPSQVNKQKRGRAPVNTIVKIPTSPISIPITTSPGPSAPIKRLAPGSDLVLESLIRLEEQQKEQKRIIEHLVNLQSGVAPKIKADPDLDFETAFRNFISAYSKISYEERPQKLRKVLNTCNKTEADNFNDLLATGNSLYQQDNQVNTEPALKLPLTLSGILNGLASDISEDSDSSSQHWDPLVNDFSWNSPESENQL